VDDDSPVVGGSIASFAVMSIYTVTLSVAIFCFAGAIDNKLG
jgi:acetyl-CoA carboxylase beta subunit